jgi:hypothetical protein
VNLYDLVDFHTTGSQPKRFKNTKALGAYSHKHHKVFPKKLAKKNRNLLRLLLRQIGYS